MATLIIDDVRRLTMPLSTAVDAVLELDKGTPQPLTECRLMSARVIGIGSDEALDPALVIEVLDNDTIRPCSHRYPLPVVAAALLNYCIKNHIPVPRSANKSIEATEEGFVLVLQCNAQVKRRHAALPNSPSA